MAIPTNQTPTHTQDQSDQSTPTNTSGNQNTTDSPSNQALMGLQEDGSYKIKLGNGMTIPAALFAEGKEADLTQSNLSIPGLKMTHFKKRSGKRPSGDLTAAIKLPRVDESNTVKIKVDGEGEVKSLKANSKVKLNFKPLNDPEIENLAFDENKQLGGSLKISSRGFKISGLDIELNGTVTLAGRDLSGQVDAKLSYSKLAEGAFSLIFGADGAITANGKMDLLHPLLKGVGAEFGLSNDELKATVSMPASKLQPPVPGLSLAGGNVTMTVTNSELSGGLEGVTVSYKDFAAGTISAQIAKGKLSGEGTFASSLAALSEVTGSIKYKNNKFSGEIKLKSSDFPEALGIKSGNITGTIDDEGKMGFSGSLAASLGPVGEGTFAASMDAEGNTAISADVELTIPGLTGSTFRVALISGQLEGEGNIPIDSEKMPGLSGAVHVVYKQNRWSGETEFNFEADGGRLSGTLKVGVEQNEEKGLNVYGGGSLTMKLSDKITGTVGANIDKEAKISLDMNIAVEPLELFPEKRVEKELFSYSQNIPLWALLVAVIRMRAGVRAGIGPGQFRNISVTGTYEIGDPEGPDLEFTGELFIPAFAEGYVGIGAGLGLSVVIGSLTGGIEAMATAGIYGAVSVKPLLEYKDGDWSMSGTAVMAAGARFKLSLNAWAEVEAFWITVWENTWELAQKTWSFGPDLALQFQMQNYILGSGEAPEITMEDPDMGAVDSMIQDAMPKDSPAPAGGRAAMKQEQAKWKGKKAGEGKKEPLTPEQTQAAGKSPKDDPKAKPPGDIPKKPTSKKKPPADANKKADGKTDKGTGKDQDSDKKTPGDTTVSEKDAASNKDPRHPMTLSMEALKEPPVPTPRTAKQKKQDLTAAEKVLKLAIKQSKSADELDDHFAAMKRRFALTEIKLIDTDKGKAVKMSINPTSTIGLPYYGDGNHGLKTEVVNSSASIGGTKGKAQVGTKMVAKLLGPEHRKGKETNGKEQPGIMDQLPVTSSRENDTKFIRGHLLNADLGGYNSNENLFPITGEANKSHLMKIESKVKDWVNGQKLWAFYQVDVAFSEKDVHVPKVAAENSRPIWQNYVECHFKCKAHLWDTTDPTNLVKSTEISADVHSKYNIKGGSTGVTDRTAKQKTEAREGNISNDKTVQGTRLSSRAVDEGLTPALVHDKNAQTQLNTSIWAGLKAAVSAGQSLDSVVSRFVTKVPGIADAAKAPLKLVYPTGKYTLSGGDKAAITRLNNLYESGQKTTIDNALKGLLPSA